MARIATHSNCWENLICNNVRTYRFISGYSLCSSSRTKVNVLKTGSATLGCWGVNSSLNLVIQHWEMGHRLVRHLITIFEKYYNPSVNYFEWNVGTACSSLNAIVLASKWKNSVPMNGLQHISCTYFCILEDIINILGVSKVFAYTTCM